LTGQWRKLGAPDFVMPLAVGSEGTAEQQEVSEERIAVGFLV
jgi:hypothetical protein